MHILVACEESQRVCEAFRKRGHTAFSCDTIEPSGGHPEWHIQADVIPLLNGNCAFTTLDGAEHYQDGKWDMIVAFPPCTYLTAAGACRMYPKKGQLSPERIVKAIHARDFFFAIKNADCERIAIENPRPLKIVQLPKETQRIQPYQFGEPYSKLTYLWLKGLPDLAATNILTEWETWIESGTSRNAGTEKTRTVLAEKKSAQKPSPESLGLWLNNGDKKQNKEVTMRGYKVFNPDWTCRDFKYAVGQTYEMEGEPICCDRGFHFCTDLKDCFDYYKFDPNNKVAVVETLGAIDTEGDKSCTNKIIIVEEITWEEVLRLVNTGKGCSGLCNSGNWNSGNCNSGNWNSGNCNSGNCNSGNCNSGNWNSGNRNSGNWNSGDWNSGNWNSGDCNSGDWNKTSFSSGVFNTEEGKILMFNKPSDWTYRNWLNSKARFLLNQIKHNLLEWVWSENMTDTEKEQHPEHTTTGGYLKVVDESECGQKWWASLSCDDKKVITSLPNFDVKIFEEITEIKIGEIVRAEREG